MRVEGILKPDPTSGHGIVIAFIHHLVHIGDVHSIIRSVAELANAASDELHIVVGAKDLHMTFSMKSGGEGTGYLYETTTKTANTTVTPYCMNRNYGNSLLSTFTHSPGGSGDGTQIWAEIIAGGTGPKAGGGQVRLGTEWILKANTSYLFKFTNSAGTTKSYSFTAEVYER